MHQQALFSSYFLLCLVSSASMADNQPESLKRLNYFIRETPFHEVLNLSNCDIDDLQVLLPTLATLPNVTILEKYCN